MDKIHQDVLYPYQSQSLILLDHCRLSLLKYLLSGHVFQLPLKPDHSLLRRPALPETATTVLLSKMPYSVSRLITWSLPDITLPP